MRGGRPAGSTDTESIRRRDDPGLRAHSPTGLADGLGIEEHPYLAKLPKVIAFDPAARIRPPGKRLVPPPPLREFGVK